MGAWEEFVKSVEEASFSEKIKFVKSVNDMCGRINYGVSSLRYDGYLERSEAYAKRFGDGDHHVYIWRHAWGDPFYVGSGKHDRWLQKSPRCDEFYLHLDQADAVVYKVCYGLDEKTARLFEKYISVNLIAGGYTLANGDNNIEYMSEEARTRWIERCSKIDNHELTPEVQKAVLSILGDKPKCDYHITDDFIMEYGADYFSRNFVFNRRRLRSEVW